MRSIFLSRLMASKIPPPSFLALYYHMKLSFWRMSGKTMPFRRWRVLIYPASYYVRLDKQPHNLARARVLIVNPGDIVSREELFVCIVKSFGKGVIKITKTLSSSSSPRTHSGHEKFSTTVTNFIINTTL